MAKEQGTKPIAQNKKARHDYAIEDKYEAGRKRFKGTFGSAEKTGSSGVDAGRRAGYWLEPKMDDTTCTGAGRNPFSLIRNPYQREPFSTQRCGC